jgi:hypothetical protein
MSFIRRNASVHLAALLAVAALAVAQRNPRPSAPAEADSLDKAAEFHFVRMQYTDHPMHRKPFSYSSRRGEGEGWWMMDWPDAEEHFSIGIQRLTRIHTGAPKFMPLTDDRIFEHPWIYATQVGWWSLSNLETARLREYLLRGGFLVVDDFFGQQQWETFRETMTRVFPDVEIRDVTDSDAIMNVPYVIAERDRVFIPGSRHLRRWGTGEAVIQQPPGEPARWRLIHDGRGRAVVMINFNSDVADAWEFADSPEYPEKLTSLAYRFGINYVMYAMTH